MPCTLLFLFVQQFRVVVDVANDFINTSIVDEASGRKRSSFKPRVFPIPAHKAQFKTVRLSHIYHVIVPHNIPFKNSLAVLVIQARVLAHGGGINGFASRGFISGE